MNMILRRRSLIALLALVFLIAGAALGQYRRPQASKGPRAIALIEFDTKGKARLVPVTIFVDGRWWDASLYKATPVPMALEPDTVYEATQNGDPVGLFTIEQAESLNGNWFGTGRWREGMEPPKKEAKPQPKELSPQDERPTLRRPGAQPKTETPPTTQKPEPAPPPAAPSPKPESTSPAAQQTPAKPESAPQEPPRPVLHRSQAGAGEQAQKLPGDVTGPSAKPVTAVGSSKTGPPAKVLVAISDEKNNEFRPFTFQWKLDEQAKLTKQMSALAVAELNTYASAHPGARPAALQDVQLRTFDLDLINEPTLVLTAKAGEAPPAPPSPTPTRGRRRAATSAPASAAAPLPTPQTVPNGTEFYVTVVARQDFNGDLHRLFSSVTDSRHLDAHPRLELIDAVDADGNSRGELLFRQINDQGRTFVIYRVGPDQLSEIYDGGAPME